MNVKLGFSTGVLYQSVHSELERIKTIRDFGAKLIELNFVKGLGEAYERITADDLADFESRDRHAPGLSARDGHELPGLDDHHSRLVLHAHDASDNRMRLKLTRVLR